MREYKGWSSSRVKSYFEITYKIAIKEHLFRGIGVFAMISIKFPHE